MLGQKRIPSREGGVEIVVEELSTRMVKMGHSVTCLNRKGHHISGKQYDGQVLNEYKGVVLKTVPTVNKKGLAAMTASFTGAFYAAFGKYDVVHFHADQSEYGDVSRIRDCGQSVAQSGIDQSDQWVKDEAH